MSWEVVVRGGNTAAFTSLTHRDGVGDGHLDPPHDGVLAKVFPDVIRGLCRLRDHHLTTSEV